MSATAPESAAGHADDVAARPGRAAGHELPEPPDRSTDVSSLERRAERARRRDELAGEVEKWEGRRAFLYREKARLVRWHVPEGARVLHVGCGTGNLLASLDASLAVGTDASERMLDVARRRHDGLHLEQMDPEEIDSDALAATVRDAGALEADEPLVFDVILVTDVLGDLDDIQACLESVRHLCAPHTRVILCWYSALWQPVFDLATKLGLRRPTDEQNWLGPADYENLLRLGGFEQVSRSEELLLPLRIPGVAWLANRFFARAWPTKHLAMMNVVVARPQARPPKADALTTTVLIPTRNEAGNVRPAIERLPDFGAGIEVIFVDGNSTDGTVEEIEQVIADFPERNIRFIPQGDGRGKGDAVRKGFAAATGDILMILDADLTVPPEDLPRFHEALASGKGEFINGTRLVYPMEDEAMRFLNKLGNRFFSMVFTWLLGQTFRDTLCGTKVLLRTNYETIARNRHYFGDFDPYGDFDLIFGAAKANLKIIEVPVRYRARTYGETSINRWEGGWLLSRMSWVAFRRLKLR